MVCVALFGLVWAHPRVGGENWPGRLNRERASGSSPRGRGKHNRPIRAHKQVGLIPAWAGKTTEASDFNDANRAHPRVGGENEKPRFRWKISTGSSPRGRGKHSPHLHNKNRERLIPAWAGKTSGASSAGASGAAHPRVGGENRVSQHLDAA